MWRKAIVVLITLIAIGLLVYYGLYILQRLPEEEITAQPTTKISCYVTDLSYQANIPAAYYKARVKIPFNEGDKVKIKVISCGVYWKDKVIYNKDEIPQLTTNKEEQGVFYILSSSPEIKHDNEKVASYKEWATGVVEHPSSSLFLFFNYPKYDYSKITGEYFLTVNITRPPLPSCQITPTNIEQTDSSTKYEFTISPPCYYRVNIQNVPFQIGDKISIKIISNDIYLEPLKKFANNPPIGRQSDEGTMEGVFFSFSPSEIKDIYDSTVKPYQDEKSTYEVRIVGTKLTVFFPYDPGKVNLTPDFYIRIKGSYYLTITIDQRESKFKELYDKGELAWKKNEWEKASGWYKEAKEKANGLNGVPLELDRKIEFCECYLKGENHWEKKEWKEALSLNKKTIIKASDLKGTPSDLLVIKISFLELYLEGETAWKGNQWQTALDCYKKAKHKASDLKDTPEFESKMLFLESYIKGETAWENKECQTALALYNKAKSFGLKDAPPELKRKIEFLTCYVEGEKAEKRKEWKEAVDWYKKAKENADNLKGSFLELGRKIESCISMIEKSENLNVLEIETNIFYERPDGYLYRVNENTVLTSKDNYCIYIKANQQCWVYIFQEDTGKIFKLFPNIEYHTDFNPIPPNIPYWLPNEEEFYYLDNTVGQEEIYILATLSPIKELEKDINIPLVKLQKKYNMGPAGVRKTEFRERKIIRKQKTVEQIIFELKAYTPCLYKFQFIHR